MADNRSRDLFIDGLIVGIVFGAAVGGAAASWLLRRREPKATPVAAPEPAAPPVADTSPESLEDARRVLDEKIAELNQAIEQTRNRLWAGAPVEARGEQAPTEPPS